MGGERLARDRSEAGDQVEDAGRKSGRLGGFREELGGERGVLGGLEDDGAAGGERGGDLRDDLVERVVPGVIAPTTPTGSSSTVELPIRSSKAYRAVSSAYEAATSTGTPACTICDSGSGEPSSAVMVSASSSLRAASASASAVSRAARSAGGVAAQAGKAARAARTAASTSSAVPAGTWAMTCSSTGFTTAIVSWPAAGRHAPSMYIWSWAFMAVSSRTCGAEPCCAERRSRATRGDTSHPPKLAPLVF